MKPLLLKLHRWIALAFALPLLVVIGTGLVLSLEPLLVDRAIAPGSLDAARVVALLEQHDPGNRARGIVHRSYDHTLTIGGGRDGGTLVDVASGAIVPSSTLSTTLLTARRLHEKLLLDAGWLVVASTVAMLVLALLGVLFRWPRFANTLSGWHMGFAWGLLPLVVLSPLTALFMAGGITFAGGPPSGAGAAAAPPTLAAAVRTLGASHDLSALVWLRQRGDRMLARIVEDGEYRVYAVTADRAVLLPRNWPRLWHEGNFAGGWSALLNLVTALGLAGLLVTGPWLWWQRRSRRRMALRRTARVAS